MITIYHVPGTRSVRPLWLCHELELDVKVERVDWSAEYRASDAWRAISPTGKVPVLTDDNLTMHESGAMVDYLLERYANGRLKPQPGTAASALHHQWCWFAEATLTRPLGLHRILRSKGETIDDLKQDGSDKARRCFDTVESALIDRDYILGDDFQAADVMLGYSLAIVEQLMGNDYPNATAYIERVKQRPAYQRAIAA